jgi:hypothetical protein
MERTGDKAGHSYASMSGFGCVHQLQADHFKALPVQSVNARWQCTTLPGFMRMQALHLDHTRGHYMDVMLATHATRVPTPHSRSAF